MEKENNIRDGLLFEKYFRDDCNEKELDSIVRELSENRLRFYPHFKKCWDNFSHERLEENKKLELLDKVHHRINLQSEVGIYKRHRSYLFYKWFSRVAAVLLLPLLLWGTWTYFSEKEDLKPGEILGTKAIYSEIYSPYGSKTQLELPDGTKVWLNDGTRLRFPQPFSKNKREVYLDGEALFEVKKDEDRPFLVKTKHLTVKALGTVFDVQAYKDDPKVETILVSGSVEVQEAKMAAKVLLSPNQKLTYQKSSATLLRTPAYTEKYTAWREGKIIFRDDPLDEIILKLRRWYNVNIILKDLELSDYTYTATFSNETLPQVLELLSKAAPIYYTFSERQKKADASFSKQTVEIGLRNEFKKDKP